MPPPRRPSPLPHPSFCLGQPPCPHPSNNPRGTVTSPTAPDVQAHIHLSWQTVIYPIPIAKCLCHSAATYRTRDGRIREQIFAPNTDYFGFLLPSHIHSVYRTPVVPSWKMECPSKLVVPQTLLPGWQSSLDAFSFRNRVNFKCW